MRDFRYTLHLLWFFFNGLVYCEIIGSTEASTQAPSTDRISVIIVIVTVLLLFGLLLIGVTIKCCQKRNPGYSQVESLREITSSLPADEARSLSNHEQQADVTDMKKKFVSRLKEVYKDLYEAAQPPPYIKDRLYSYDKVFVECGLEELISMSEEEDGTRWKKMKSYEDMFGNPSTIVQYRELEGDSGYGKSTVMLQLAYGWSIGKPISSLNDVDILILMNVRHMRNATSIFKTMKEFFLPTDSSLTEIEIRDIMLKSKSAVFLLDGLDVCHDADILSSVIKEFKIDNFHNFEVVFTTMSSTSSTFHQSLTKRFRLTGFPENAKRFYIRKAVVGNDDKRVEQIVRYLHSNPIVSDLSQLPLFFTIFAHFAHENEQFRKLNTVTSIFRYMISCFHSHVMSQVKNSDMSQFETFVIDHLELDKIAFEALSSDDGKIFCQKENLCEKVGKEFYEHYVRIGILVEEEVAEILDDYEPKKSENFRRKIHFVRFYHRTFCEWYAAHYLSECIEQNPDTDLQEYLQHLDPFNFQYTYRFVCGLNPNCTKQIVNYLYNIDGGEQFSLMCLFEQSGRFDQIGHLFRGMCSEGVIFSQFDSPLLQRSLIQLIHLASGNGITIDKVILHDCFQSVDVSEAAIRINTSMVLYSKVSVKWLSIHMHSREIFEDEAIDLLTFSSMCSSLNHLSYIGCVPPYSFESSSVLSTLRSRNVKVSWNWRDNEPTYTLNLDSGRWQDESNGSELKAEDHETMQLHNVKERKEWTDETYRE